MKKIDHFYKNLDIDKLIDVLNNWKPNLLQYLVDDVTKCVNGYNEINDEDVHFRTYFETLLLSGEFFLNLKEYFSINSYYILETNEDIRSSEYEWRQVYILYCKRDNNYRLMHIECTFHNHRISILDTITDHDIRRIKAKDKDGREYTIAPRKYYLQILDKHFEQEDYLYEANGEHLKHIKGLKNWPHYYHGHGHFNLGKKYYEKNYKEALELEHKDRTPDGKIPNDKTPEKKTYDGELLDGKMNGLGTLTIKDEYKYIGAFKDNLFHGQGTFISNNGDKYVGQWQDGEMEGKGTFTKPNGEQYVGEYKNNNKHGKGSYTFSFGDQYVGEYKNDVYDGKGTFTGSDGKITSGIFKNGKLVK